MQQQEDDQQWEEAAAARHVAREENRQRKATVLRVNNALFSTFLAASVGMQIAAIILLLVSVVCRAALFASSYPECHRDSLIALCCMVGAWALVGALALLVSWSARHYASQATASARITRR